MRNSFLIAGGGIGGLSLALALGLQKNCHLQLWEQSPAFAPVGAGIQLGSNAVRLLDGWGLGAPLRAAASRPNNIIARDASSGRTLGKLPLGDAFLKRYGSDYLTIHRADLHAILLQAVQKMDIDIQCNTVLQKMEISADCVQAHSQNGMRVQVQALIGCDGLWSSVRQGLLQDAKPTARGQWAYRSKVAVVDVPWDVSRTDVSTWLAPHLHAVCYPMQSGAWLNVVLVASENAHTIAPSDPRSWSVDTSKATLLQTLALSQRNLATPLRELINSCQDWQAWALYERSPLAGADEMAQGRIALLGDAAHPMHPHLGQGGAMAIEDAHAFASAVATCANDVKAALQRYAQMRWQRNARVQRKSRRNGLIFQSRGVLRLGRDVALALAPEKLMDTPWLYRGV